MTIRETQHQVVGFYRTCVIGLFEHSSVEYVRRHPKTTMRYDRARKTWDRHPNNVMAPSMPQEP